VSQQLLLWNVARDFTLQPRRCGNDPRHTARG